MFCFDFRIVTLAVTDYQIVPSKSVMFMLYTNGQWSRYFHIWAVFKHYYCSFILFLSIEKLWLVRNYPSSEFLTYVSSLPSPELDQRNLLYLWPHSFPSHQNLHFILNKKRSKQVSWRRNKMMWRNSVHS